MLSPSLPVGPFDPFFLSLIPKSSRKYLLFPPFHVTSLPSPISLSSMRGDFPTRGQHFLSFVAPTGEQNSEERREKKRRKRERGEKTPGPRTQRPGSGVVMATGAGRKRGTRGGRGRRAPRGGGGPGEGSGCPGSTSPLAPSSSPARSPQPAAPTLSARQEVTGLERAPEAWQSRGRVRTRSGGRGGEPRPRRVPPTPPSAPPPLQEGEEARGTRRGG